MPQRASWSRLGIGIAAGCAIIGAALLILIFGRVGVLHGSKFTLYVTTASARGVIRGTDVWLDGQKVGVVRKVEFQPPSVGRSERLVLSLELLRTIRDRIRRDSRVQLRAGGSILGDQVVSVQSGTTKQPGVSDGDTLHARQEDRETLTSEFGLASREFPAIIQNVRLLSAQLKSAEGTLGALGLDGGGGEMAVLRRRTKRLMDQLSESKGSVSLMMNNSSVFRDRAARALAQVDSIRALLGSNKHSLGRFRRDSSIVREIKAIRRELANVARLASDSTTGIGRLRSDSAIVRGVHRDLLALDSLMADIKKRPMRYIAF